MLSKVTQFIFVLVIISMLFMTSCQKTPEKSIVVNRNDNALEKAIEESNKEDKEVVIDEYLDYDAPESYQLELEKYNGKLKIAVDAKIIIPNIDEVPIVGMVPAQIPIEQANKIVKELFGDAKVYVSKIELTKSELEEHIVRLKGELEAAKKEGDKQKIEDFENLVEINVARLPDAPEFIEPKLYDGNYMTINDSSEFLSLEADMGYEHIVQLDIESGNKNRNACVSLDGWRNRCGYRGKDRYSDEVKESAKDSIDIVEKVLHNIGVDYMDLQFVFPMSKVESDDVISGYWMIFRRTYNDIPMPAFLEKGGNRPLQEEPVDTETYVHPLPKEEIWVYTCDGVIREFRWSGICEITHTITDNVKLLPFQDIMNNFSKMAAVKYAYVEDGEAKPRMSSIYIDEIKLSYMRQPIKDKIGEYMLVPVWGFYGGYTDIDITQHDGTVEHFDKQPEMRSLLTINAVDGSLVINQ